MSIALPNKGTNRLKWAREITREVNRNKPKAGAGLAESATDAGTVLSVKRPDAAMRLPFEVSVDDGEIVVRAGRHFWYNTATGAYVKTTLSTATAGWSGVTIPTAGNSLFIYVMRTRDSGAATATVTAGTNATESTVMALADTDVRVWIIAALSADADGLLTIEQRIAVDLEDGPTAVDGEAPGFGEGFDGVPGGIICMWSGTTPPSGWYLCDGTNGTPDLRGRFIVGYSGSGDYTQPGDKSEGGSTAGGTGGAATHGDGTNDHLPHKVNHSHPVTVCLGTNPVVCIARCVTGEYAIKPTASICVTLNDKCYDLLDPVEWWCRETDDPPNTSQIEDGADHGADAGENVAWHSETDNRPPYYVLAYVMKAL